jgi:methyl-accepting chemotaxis protein
MKNLNFRGKTMLGFGSIIALFTFIVAFCVFEISQIHGNIVDISVNVQPYEMLADQMALDTIQVQQFLTDASATHKRDGFVEAEKHARSFKENITSFKKHFADHPDTLKQLDAVDTSFDRYYSTGKRMAETFIAGGTDAGNVEMEVFDRDAADITQKMGEFRNYVLTFATDKMNEATGTAKSGINLSITIALIGIVIGLGLAWRLSTGLLNEIGIDPMYARGIAKEIAKGNLSRDITLNPGDNGSLLFAMRSMQIKLREMISEVTKNANSIVDSAHHLSESAQEVLFSSQRQNDAATSVAAAVEEMTSSIDQISGNADQSEKIAKQSGIISDQGGKVVSDAVDEMNKIASSVSQSSQIIRELGASSQKISEIVNVIKEIADQTNLLALNAAIEAARAGEQGRGFAVVADEVRKLAERTAKSTQEITSMITEIQNGASNAVASMEEGTLRVTDGVEKARRAGSSMAQIKEGTEQVVSTVADITAALREQSTAVGSVAKEVDLIASMVHDNTASVDDLAKTSNRLNVLADELKESISHFKF